MMNHLAMETVEIIKKLEEVYINFGYPLVFISSFIEITPMGWTIPGGLILAGGGFYSFGGKISLWGILISGWLGAWSTLLSAYFLGLKSGDWFIQRFKQEKNASRARLLLKNHGGLILTTSMLANLTRFWVAYVAGNQKYNLLKFLFYSATASLTWSSLMVVTGYIVGSERKNIEKIIGSLGIISWILFAIAVGVIYVSVKKEFKKSKNEDSKR